MAKIFFVGNILEADVVESLVYATKNLGHEVLHLPIRTYELNIKKVNNRTYNAIEKWIFDQVESFEPEILFNFIGQMIPIKIIKKIRARGIRTFVWFPDDPVGYNLAYKDVAPYYDVVLNCGDENVLNYYYENLGVRGINFPFWIDEAYAPFKLNEKDFDRDLIFLGLCKGAVKSKRYELLTSFPFKVEAFGLSDHDDKKIFRGNINNPLYLAYQISKSAFGIDNPQIFSNYSKDNIYYFNDLGSLGSFQYPMRIIRYAACGVPTISIRPGPNTLKSFPELNIFEKGSDSFDFIKYHLENLDALYELSEKNYQRYVKSFSANARAFLLQELIDENKTIKMQNSSVSERTHMFAAVYKKPLSTDTTEEGDKNNRELCRIGVENFIVIERHNNPGVLSMANDLSSGGFETRLRDQNTFLRGQKYRHYLCVNNYQKRDSDGLIFNNIITGIDFKNRNLSVNNYLQNIYMLVKFIKDNNIDLIHAHTPDTYISGYLIAVLSNVKFIITIHSPLFLNAMTSKFNLKTLVSLVLQGADDVICVSQEVKDAITYYTNKISVIPNRIDLNRFKPKDSKSDKTKIAIVSRFDAYKFRGIQTFITMLSSVYSGTLDFYGDGEYLERLVEEASSLGISCNKNGVSDTLEDDLTKNYFLVAGMGRVLLESAALNIPALSLGYEGVNGLLTEELVHKLKYSNYSGRGIKNISYPEFRYQFEQLCHNPDTYKLRSLFQSQLNQLQDWSTLDSIMNSTKTEKSAEDDCALQIISVLERHSSLTSTKIHENIDVYADICEIIDSKFQERSVWGKIKLQRNDIPIKLKNNENLSLKFTDIVLKEKPFVFQIKSESNAVLITYNLECENPEKHKALVAIKYGDDTKVPQGLNYSNAIGYYQYLLTENKSNKYRLKVPVIRGSFLELGFRTWHAKGEIKMKLLKVENLYT